MPTMFNRVEQGIFGINTSVSFVTRLVYLGRVSTSIPMMNVMYKYNEY